MGLFSGGFGTGLATGLAESVDQGLKNAMEKRDKELSRARTFWETRQAQKMDLADAHDERAESALNQFIDEFGGDVAKGLAAYKHFGTVDKAEAGLAEIEATRAALPGPYNLEDHFTFKGIDLGQFADLSREDAFGSIRKEVKPLDIQMEDTGLLAKIGLGAKDMGGQVSASINELVPARTRTAIKGLTAAVFDRSGTITSITQQNAMEQAALRGEDRLFQINGIVSAGMYRGKKLDEHDILKYQQEAARILETTGALAEAKARGDDADSGPTASQISSALTAELAELETELNFSKSGNVVSIRKRGEDKVTTDGVDEYWKQESTRTVVDFIKVNILDEDGEFVSSGARQVTDLRMLSDEVEIAQREIAEAKAAEEEAEDVPGEGEGSLDAAAASAAAGEEAASAETEDIFEPIAVGTGDFTVTSEPQLNSFIKNFPEDYVQGAINSGVSLNRDALEARLTELGVEPAKIQAALALVPQQSVSTEGLEPVAARPIIGRGVRSAAEAKRIREEQAAWDAQYGQTHNPDGSLKG